MADIPNEDWRKSVVEAATKVVEGAQPELIDIVTTVILQHGRNLFQRSEADRVALLIHEIQDQSFLLGIKKGVQMVMDTMTLKPSETKTSGVQ